MIWFLLTSSLLATQPATAPATGAAPTVLVVLGAEGASEYGADFARSADRWGDAANRGSSRFVLIGRDGASPHTLPATRPASGPTTGPATSPADDKQRLRAALDAESRDADVTRPLWLVFIGHGTFDGREAKFNLRGPDVSDVELLEWLKPCRRPLAVIDGSAASAPFLNRLSAPARVIITATRSGHEIQYARFGDHLSAAIADPAADLDKDGQTSLLEAFLAASHRTEEFYKQAGRLATEHALLDDNGDTLGTPAEWFQGVRATKSAKDGAPLDGLRAHQWHLVLSAGDRAMPPAVRARRDELELKVEALRARKATLRESDYYAQLEALLLELARLYDQQPAADPTNQGKPR